MVLKDIFPLLKPNYNSRIDNIIEDFYKPCFKNSIRFYRGSAFFRTSVMELYREEVLDFCRFKNSKIAILTSTDVIQKDVNAIRDGYLQRQFEKSLDELFSEAKMVNSTKFVSTLIAMNKLDIFIVNGPLYHDKVGFFEDSKHDIVSFTGSGNETKPGLGIDGNFERYVASWSSSSSFEEYGMHWSNELRNAIDKLEYAGAEIVRFDKFTGQFLHKHEIKKSLDGFDELKSIEYDVNYFDYNILSPNGPQKHQLRAYRGWIDNNHRGLFEHATGTYKTATGLLCADHYLGTNDHVVISAPLRIIADNWYDLVSKCFDSRVAVIKCWGDNSNWKEELSNLIDSGKKGIFLFVNKSLWNQDGINALKVLKNRFLLIADEAHNWERQEAKFFMHNVKPSSRIALTARLSEPNQEEKMEDVLNYFATYKSAYIDSLSLADAISMGFLRKYHYTLLPIECSHNFRNGVSKNAGIAWRDFQSGKRLHAPLTAVESLITKSRVLVYSGPNVDHIVPILEEMQDIWNRKHSTTGLFKKMTGREGSYERVSIIEEFTGGITRGLVAIKVLDEGVDLPISDAAVMAKSNASFRQWTQRRGRILRKKMISDQSTAIIFDYILNISNIDFDIADKIREDHKSEIDRIIEFSRCSINGEQVAKDVLKQCGWL